MDRERFRRRHLLHWDMPGAAYFVTACLADGIPARGLVDIAKFTDELHKRSRPKELAADEWKNRLWKLAFLRVEHWLDIEPANRALADPAPARIVADAMYHFAGERYDLIAYVIMPSHLHWLFRSLPGWVRQLHEEDRTPRERIMYSLKRFTANACNQVLNMHGAFWQGESHDHWVRDTEELERIIHYIEENPVKTGLVQSSDKWQFSSASARKIAGVEYGSPLPKGRSGSES